MNFSDPAFKKAARILRAIVHPLRLKIIGFIDKKGSTNVNKIYRSLHLEQSITSQHLKILRDAGLVYTERDGKFIYYKVNYDKLDHVVKTVNAFIADRKK